MTASPAPPAAGPPATPATAAVLRYAARLLERRDLRRAVWRAADRDPATYRRLMRAHLAAGRPAAPEAPRQTTIASCDHRTDF